MIADDEPHFIATHDFSAAKPGSSSACPFADSLDGLRDLGYIATMEKLPDKIASALNQQLKAGEMVALILKTAWKPSATIPLLWLAITNRRCILFSSLRGSHVFREASFGEINSVARNGTRLQVLLGASDQDWDLPINTAFQPFMDQAIQEINGRK